MATGANAATGSYGTVDWVAAVVKKVEEVSSSVDASGGDLATESEPMTPAAPPRLSTITLLPRRLASEGAMARAMTSLLPPGGKGTTMRISGGNCEACWADAVGMVSVPVNTTDS